jgi:hypothetical protein
MAIISKPFLTNLIETPENSIILAGDFNIDLMKQDRNANRFRNILESFGLQPSINSPTGISETKATCIDNIIINLNIE